VKVECDVTQIWTGDGRRF